MDEILYELRPTPPGSTAGRWDYIFSVIKKFGRRPEFVLPDRAQVTMGVPFMRAYVEQLVRTCHRRGAHAIGGMAAFIPSRRDEEVNAHGAGEGAGGQGARGRPRLRRRLGGPSRTWCRSRPRSSTRCSATGRTRSDRRRGRSVDAARLLDVRIPRGAVTEAGVRGNVSVALQYLEAWLRGSGAVAINNLMEDAATAEIARAQLWQWIHHGHRGRERPAGDARPGARVAARRVGRPGQGPGPMAGCRRAARRVGRGEGRFPQFLTLAAYQRARGVRRASPSVTDDGGHWGGWGRTSNLPVNSRALCRLSYTPKHLVRGQTLYLCWREGAVKAGRGPSRRDARSLEHPTCSRRGRCRRRWPPSSSPPAPARASAVTSCWRASAAGRSSLRARCRAAGPRAAAGERRGDRRRGRRHASSTSWRSRAAAGPW